jgi:hypothetical protein
VLPERSQSSTYIDRKYLNPLKKMNSISESGKLVNIIYIIWETNIVKQIKVM